MCASWFFLCLLKKIRVDKFLVDRNKFLNANLSTFDGSASRRSPPAIRRAATLRLKIFCTNSKFFFAWRVGYSLQRCGWSTHEHDDHESRAGRVSDGFITDISWWLWCRHVLLHERNRKMCDFSTIFTIYSIGQWSNTKSLSVKALSNHCHLASHVQKRERQRRDL